MRKVAIIGIGMHPCGKFVDKGLSSLGYTAVWDALKDAEIKPGEVEVAYVGNTLAGLITGQEGVRGQSILNYTGFGGIPMINVESACGSGSLALQQAWLAVASGAYDVALALGVEKLYCGDTSKSIGALSSTGEVYLTKMGFQFLSWAALISKAYMWERGITIEQVAKVVVKSSQNAQFNPYAQYRSPHSLEEVLNSRVVVDPFTLYMCAPIGDGAAAAILCAEDKLKKYTAKPPVGIAACVQRTAGIYQSATTFPLAFGAPSRTVAQTAQQAYEIAGIGPTDIDLAEVHDPLASVELMHYEELGFCKEGMAGHFIDEGRTGLNGDIVVNPSGGVIARGHPIGATGLMQVAEIVWQLRGEAGHRQVANARVGMAQIAGGVIENDYATSFVTIFKKLVK